MLPGPPCVPRAIAGLATDVTGCRHKDDPGTFQTLVWLVVRALVERNAWPQNRQRSGRPRLDWPTSHDGARGMDGRPSEAPSRPLRGDRCRLQEDSRGLRPRSLTLPGQSPALLGWSPALPNRSSALPNRSIAADFSATHSEAGAGAVSVWLFLPRTPHGMRSRAGGNHGKQGG